MKYASTTFFFDFFKVVERIFFSKKKVVNAYFFFEFGESLEILQTHFFPIFQKREIHFLKNDIKQRFLCEFGVSSEILQTLSKLTKLAPNSLQTHMFSFFRGFSVLLFFLKRWMSLERVWRFSKLSPNPLQTHMCSFFLLYFFYFTCVFFEKEDEFGVSLEILQTLSKLICFHFFVFTFLDKRNKFEVSLEILQTDSKFGPSSYVFFILLFLKRGMSLEWVWSQTPNSIQTQMISFLLCFPFIVFLIFVWKRQTTWSQFGDSPNSLQTHAKLAPKSYVFRFFCFCLFFSFIMYFAFLGKEEGVWSEFGDSPNSP